MDILCAGPGPHDPSDGVLGETDTDVDLGMLCPPCTDKAVAAAQAEGRGLVTVQVDPTAIDAALTAAQKATTVAGLRSAVVALAQQMQS